MQSLSRKNNKNPIIGYLNINHLRNKVIDLRPIIQDVDFHFLAIAETKFDDSYPSAQFQIDGYLNTFEFRKDRNCNGGGILIYIKRGTPCKRLRIYESSEIESIVVELRIGSKKLCILTIYRSEPITPDDFFTDISKSLDVILNAYENIIIIGDININSLN